MNDWSEHLIEAMQCLKAASNHLSLAGPVNNAIRERMHGLAEHQLLLAHRAVVAAIQSIGAGR